MKTKIMKQAWMIARDGQANFGGSVKLYISESLKIAWKQAKTGEKKMEYEMAFPMSGKQEEYINDLKQTLKGKIEIAKNNVEKIRTKKSKSAAADRIENVIKESEKMINEDPTSSKGAGPDLLIFRLKNQIKHSWLVRDYA